jgi:hypothetical protein
MIICSHASTLEHESQKHARTHQFMEVSATLQRDVNLFSPTRVPLTPLSPIRAIIPYSLSPERQELAT